MIWAGVLVKPKVTNPWFVKALNTKNRKTDYCTGKHYDTVLSTQKSVLHNCKKPYKEIYNLDKRHCSSSAKTKHQMNFKV